MSVSNCLSVGSRAGTGKVGSEPRKPGQCTARARTIASAQVKVVDPRDGPVRGAVVNSRFLDTDDLDGKVSLTTNLQGVATAQHSGPACVGAIAFFADRVNKSGLTLDRSVGTLTSFVIAASAPVGSGGINLGLRIAFRRSGPQVDEPFPRLQARHLGHAGGNHAGFQRDLFLRDIALRQRVVADPELHAAVGEFADGAGERVALRVLRTFEQEVDALAMGDDDDLRGRVGIEARLARSSLRRLPQRSCAECLLTSR